jgi:hypothetical protein
LLGKTLSKGLFGRERKRSGLHLLESPETGKLGLIGDMFVFLAHGDAESQEQITKFSGKNEILNEDGTS